MSTRITYAVLGAALVLGVLWLVWGRDAGGLLMGRSPAPKGAGERPSPAMDGEELTS